MDTAAGTDPGRAPAISLILTVRDGAPYIAQAIDSVRAQTFADWELVVWDDGSTDDTLAVVRARADVEPRIRVFASDRRGRRAALVEAHARARGRYLGWVDADDWLAPEALDRTHAVIARTGCDLVYTDHIVVGPAGEPRGLGRRSQIPYSARRLLLDFITFHFRLFSRDVFERAGGIDRELEIAIDYDLCLRISEHGRIVHLAEPLYFYRRHEGQLSARRRAEQVEASARAIRRALARRRSAHTLVVEPPGRFRLAPVRSPEARSLAGWVRLALATFVPAVRPTRTRTVQLVASWPPARHSAYRELLTAAAERARVATRMLPRALPAFMRAVWTGQAGDVLHLHGFAPLLHAPDRGSALARCHLFVRTIDHALARGMRVVWTSPGPLAAHPRYAAEEAWCRRALAARCHAIVTHWRPDLDALRELGAGDRAVFVPHPDVTDAYPVISRADARAQLGLVDRTAPVVLHIGGAARGLALAPDLDQRASRDVAFHLAAADVVAFTSAAAVTATGLAAARAAGRPIVAPAVPGVAEAAGEAAILYAPAGGEAALASALAHVRMPDVRRAPAQPWDAVLAALVG